MKNVFWLIVGTVLGFVAAHLASNDPRGRKLLDTVDTKTRQFTDAVVDGYKDREAELRSTVGDVVSDVEDAMADLNKRDE